MGSEWKSLINRQFGAILDAHLLIYLGAPIPLNTIE